MLTAIAGRESSFQSEAECVSCIGDVAEHSVGLLQVNLDAHAGQPVSNGEIVSATTMKWPVTNLTYGLDLLRSSGTAPWRTIGGDAGAHVHAEAAAAARQFVDSESITPERVVALIREAQ